MDKTEHKSGQEGEASAENAQVRPLGTDIFARYGANPGVARTTAGFGLGESAAAFAMDRVGFMSDLQSRWNHANAPRQAPAAVDRVWLRSPYTWVNRAATQANVIYRRTEPNIVGTATQEETAAKNIGVSTDGDTGSTGSRVAGTPEQAITEIARFQANTSLSPNAATTANPRFEKNSFSTPETAATPTVHSQEISSVTPHPVTTSTIRRQETSAPMPDTVSTANVLPQESSALSPDTSVQFSEPPDLQPNAAMSATIRSKESSPLLLHAARTSTHIQRAEQKGMVQRQSPEKSTISPNHAPAKSSDTRPDVRSERVPSNLTSGEVLPPLETKESANEEGTFSNFLGSTQAEREVTVPRSNATVQRPIISRSARTEALLHRKRVDTAADPVKTGSKTGVEPAAYGSRSSSEVTTYQPHISAQPIALARQDVSHAQTKVTDLLSASTSALENATHEPRRILLASSPASIAAQPDSAFSSPEFSGAEQFGPSALVQTQGTMESSDTPARMILRSSAPSVSEHVPSPITATIAVPQGTPEQLSTSIHRVQTSPKQEAPQGEHSSASLSQFTNPHPLLEGRSGVLLTGNDDGGKLSSGANYAAKPVQLRRIADAEPNGSTMPLDMDGTHLNAVRSEQEAVRTKQGSAPASSVTLPIKPASPVQPSSILRRVATQTSSRRDEHSSLRPAKATHASPRANQVNRQPTDSAHQSTPDRQFVNTDASLSQLAPTSTTLPEALATEEELASRNARQPMIDHINTGDSVSRRSLDQVPSSAGQNSAPVIVMPSPVPAVNAVVPIHRSPAALHHTPRLNASSASVASTNGHARSEVYLSAPDASNRSQGTPEMIRPATAAPAPTYLQRSVAPPSIGTRGSSPATPLSRPSLPTATSIKQPTPAESNITHIANRVYDLLVRRLANERQRRGA